MRFTNTLIVNSILLLLLGFSSASAQSLPLDSVTAQLEAEAIDDYSVGRYRTAIKKFQGLRKVLKKQNHTERYFEISVLIAYAQEALGYPREACSTLQRMIDANPYLCYLDRSKDEDTSLASGLDIPATRNHVVATISLANIMRDFGEFDEAITFLDIASAKAQQLDDEQLIAGVQIGYGNLLFVKLKLQRDRLAYQENTQLSTQATKKVEGEISDAYQFYKLAMKSSLQRDARFKWLALYEEHQKWSQLLSFSDPDETEFNVYKSVMEQLIQDDWSGTTEIEKANYQLQLAEHLFEFTQKTKSKSALIQSFTLAEEVININESGNNLLLSKTYGHIGRLYASTNQLKLAIAAFERASQHAQRINQPSQFYKWQYETAKLLVQQEKLDRAAEYFDAAIASIKEVEQDIASLSSDFRLNFQERTSPIFDDYLKLLLDQAQPDYQQIIHVQQEFAASKLQNYIGCGALKSISPNEIFDQDKQATIVNIFKIQNYYHLILQKERSLVSHKISRSKIDKLLAQIQVLLSSEEIQSPKLLNSYLQKLYIEIILPIEPDLDFGNTVLFSLDSSFQNIPIGMLFDGKQYLLEKHPMALISPQLYKPQALSQEDKEKILFAGISQPNPNEFSGFSPLPFVNIEAQAIDPAVKIINQKFTREKLLEKLTQATPIIHIASHGQFSSDPQQTFLLAWDNKITLDSLASVVGDRAQNTPSPIELLVLSACETAKGDRLATLGMAGITVQAGARSTIASLWRSQDESSAMLMEDFYKFLRAGNGKAKALQLAQIEQIKQGRSPYNWGNFVLVGSWL